MKHWYGYILSIALLVAACKPDDKFSYNASMANAIPDSVLAFDSMVAVTLDIHLAEALVNESGPDSLSKDERLKIYYAQIFSIHHISSERYKRSYDYFVAHPVLMQEMYTRVTEKLNLMEAENAAVKKTKKDE